MTARDARGRFTKACEDHHREWSNDTGRFTGTCKLCGDPGTDLWHADYDTVQSVAHGPHVFDPFPTVPDTCRTCIRGDLENVEHAAGWPAAETTETRVATFDEVYPHPEVNVTINGEHVDAEVDITAEGVNVVLEINGDADQFRDMIRGWVEDASRWEDSAALLRGTARKSDPVIVHTDEATGWIVEGELDRIPTYRWALIVALVCAIGWAVTAYALVQQATNR